MTDRAPWLISIPPPHSCYSARTCDRYGRQTGDGLTPGQEIHCQAAGREVVYFGGTCSGCEFPRTAEKEESKWLQEV
jgi:hypothetical protein